jgi:hypothetical protein
VNDVRSDLAQRQAHQAEIALSFLGPRWLRACHQEERKRNQEQAQQEGSERLAAVGLFAVIDENPVLSKVLHGMLEPEVAPTLQS